MWLWNGDQGEKGSIMVIVESARESSFESARTDLNGEQM